MHPVPMLFARLSPDKRNEWIAALRRSANAWYNIMRTRNNRQHLASGVLDE